MDTSGGGAPALAQSWHSRGVVLAAKKLRPEPALSLALLRVVVALMFLLAPGFAAGVQVAAWDPARFVVPEGLHWFVAIAPIRVDFARVAQGAVLFFAVLGALGVYARAAFTGLTLSGFYLFAIAQLTGFVWHDMHLLWFSAVLAISPCADVLAYDAEHPWDHEHERYALPLLVVRLLFGVIYFFPGFRKLYVSGTAWVFSDNLHNQLYWKWLQHGEVPAFRIDQIPYALQAGGAFVIAFELGFIFLVLFRRVRPWLAICGVLFHLMTEAIFRIPFASLWLCYVALVDLRPILRPGESRYSRSATAPWIVRCLVLREAGLDPSSVAAYQMDVVLMRLLPAALNNRRVADAEQLCHEIAAKLRESGASLSEPPMEDTAYDVFARLDAEGPGGKRR